MSDGMYRNSREIGNIGESIAIAEFVKFGLPVFLPFGQNTPVDLLVYIKGRFLKIQVKTTEKNKDGKMLYELTRTNGFTGKHTKYKKEEVDYFFLYCMENDYRGLVSFEEINGKAQFTIRCKDAKNNQRKKINLMDDYKFENVIKELAEVV